MTDDDQALKLRQHAIEIQFSDPEEAIRILKDVVSRFPDTDTVKNYVVNDIISIPVANEMWDEAIRACEVAKEIRPDNAKSYRLEAVACKLEKEGRTIEALETRLQRDTMHGKWFGTIRDYAGRFSDLGADHRAWELYQEAVDIALTEGKSPHTVRASMAEVLLEGGEPEQATEILIHAVGEAERLSKSGAPKYLVSLLNKSLGRSGVSDGMQIKNIVKEAKNSEPGHALRLFGQADRQN